MGDLVSDALVKKLNSDKIFFSDAGPTIHLPGIESPMGDANMKKYLMELCWAVAKVCRHFFVALHVCLCSVMEIRKLDGCIKYKHPLC
jgi:hypothetical protein